MKKSHNKNVVNELALSFPNTEVIERLIEQVTETKDSRTQQRQVRQRPTKDDLLDKEYH